MSFFKKVKQYMTGRYTSDYTYRTGIYNRLLLNILYVINQKYGLNL